MSTRQTSRGYVRAADIGEWSLFRFLFASKPAAVLWLVARVYLGYQWLEAGWEKVTGTSSPWQWAYTKDSWLRSGAGLKGFAGFALSLNKGPHAAVNYGWYAAFLRWLETNAGWMAPIIAVGETVIGALLILGAFTGIVAFLGSVLSFSFGLAGVAGVNPVFLVIEFLLILAWRNAGYFGLDRWLLPKVGTPWQRGELFDRRATGPPPPVPAAEGPPPPALATEGPPPPAAASEGLPPAAPATEAPPPAP